MAITTVTYKDEGTVQVEEDANLTNIIPRGNVTTVVLRQDPNQTVVLGTNTLVTVKDASYTIVTTASEQRVQITSVGFGSVVADHGRLIGLKDDDHEHYHNDQRGDARYSPLSHTHSALETSYDNSNSDIVAGDVKGALDEDGHIELKAEL